MFSPDVSHARRIPRALPLLILTFFATATFASPYPWRGDNLERTIERLRGVDAFATVDQVIDVCAARLVGPGVFAGHGTSEDEIAVALRLAELHPTTHGFVTISKVMSAPVPSFDGVAFARDGRVVANLSLRILDSLGEKFWRKLNRWTARAERHGTEREWLADLRSRAGHFDSAFRRSRQTRMVFDDLANEFTRTMDRQALLRNLFVTSPRRPIWFVVYARQNASLATDDVNNFKRFSREIKESRFLIMQPRGAREFVDGEEVRAYRYR